MQILRTAGHAVVEIRRPIELLTAARVIRCDVCCVDDSQLGRDALVIVRAVEGLTGIIFIGEHPPPGTAGVRVPLDGEELRAAIGVVAPCAPMLVAQRQELALDRERRTALAHGREVWLTRTQARLLQLLLERRPAAVSSAEILREVWGYEEGDVDPELVRTHVRNLRRKLAELGLADAVQSQRGHGYRLVT